MPQKIGQLPMGMERVLLKIHGIRKEEYNSRKKKQQKHQPPKQEERSQSGSCRACNSDKQWDHWMVLPKLKVVPVTLIRPKKLVL